MLDSQIERLRLLPQRKDEVWQGALVRMCSWVKGEDGSPCRPWVAAWIAVKADRISAPDLCLPNEANSARLVEGFVKLAADARLGGYRPGRVEVRDPELAEHLRGLLSGIGITVECRETLPALDDAMAAMAEAMNNGPPPPGALSGKGVTPERMRRFADAAQTFYSAAPWKHLVDEDLIQIEAPDPPKGMGFVSVLGAGGEVLGLGFHETPKDCWDMHRLDGPAEWFQSRKRGIWQFAFDQITSLPFGDVDLWEEHGLPVAGPDAYPCAVHYDPRKGISRPDAPRLAFLEGLLRALSQTTELQIDSGRWTIVVDTFDGAAEFTLALPDLLNPPSREEVIRRGHEPDRRGMEQMHAQMDRFLEEKQFETMDAINDAIQREFMGKAFDSSRHPPRNALERAQDLCYEAFDCIGRRQLQLARQAIGICPDCADAYVLLAERTSDLDESARLYAEGVAAGERALGKERFEEDAGHFWGITSTRPYMRARFGLACCLEELGQHEQAVEHYRELLRLNPGDNQGVRYRYLPLLLKLNRDAEAARFMKESGDEVTAHWAYTRTLLAYRLGGDCSAAQAELRKALKLNRHVVRHLLHGERPVRLPPHYALGSEEEAAYCASELYDDYSAQPGALQWLAKNAPKLSPDDAGQPGSLRERRQQERNQRRRERNRKRKRRE
jgi:tetratricopeptide (TPR) repeat protein